MVRQAQIYNDMGYLGGLNFAQQNEANYGMLSLPSLDLSSVHKVAGPSSSARRAQEEKGVQLPALGAGAASARTRNLQRQGLPAALQLPLLSSAARNFDKAHGREPAPIVPPDEPAPPERGTLMAARRRIFATPSR